jgi:hypothetical protein
MLDGLFARGEPHCAHACATHVREGTLRDPGAVDVMREREHKLVVIVGAESLER